MRLTGDEHDAPCQVGDIIDAELALGREPLVYDSRQGGAHSVAVDEADAGVKYAKFARISRLGASTYSAEVNDASPRAGEGAPAGINQTATTW